MKTRRAQKTNLASLLAQVRDWGYEPDLTEATYHGIIRSGIRSKNLPLAFVATQIALEQHPLTLRGLLYQVVSEGCLSSAQLDAGDYRPNWHINGIMAAGHSCILAGSSKTLKTTIAIDGAVSLATATPFLGHFGVKHKRRVYFLSAESGEFTCQETARRVLAAKGLPGVKLADLPIEWYFKGHDLTTARGLDDLAAALEFCAAEVLFLDPAYKTVMSAAVADDAKNLFAMGGILGAVDEVCRSLGTTLVLLHHANGRVQVGMPMELEHLAYSGFAQHFRQWVLLSRRTRYAGDGRHALYLNQGGSVGHGGLYAVDVDEGRLATDFSGRRWEVVVRGVGALREEAEDEAQQRKARQVRDDGTAVLVALDKLASEGGAAVYTQVRAAAHLSNDRMTRAVLALANDGVIEEAEVVIKTGKNLKVDKPVRGLRRASLATDGSDGTLTGQMTVPSVE